MPTSKKTTLRFQYFRCCYFEGNEDTNHPYDLFPFWKSLEGESLTDRIKEFNGIKGRLEQCYRFPHHPNLLALRFMRLDEMSDAYTVKPDAAARHVDLEDDEYLGKNTLALYDANSKVIMIQSNRGGFSWNNIMGYINSFAFMEETKCCLVPLLDSQDLIQKINNGGKVTKLKISFTDVRRCNGNRSDDFKRSLDFARGLGCVTANFELGLGRKHERPMNSRRTIDFIRDVAENLGYISTARFRVESDDASEMIDILPSVLRTMIEVKLEARKGLDFDHATKQMVLKYNETMGRIHTPW